MSGTDEQRARLRPSLRSALGRRLPAWAVGVVALLLAGTAAAGVVAAGDLREDQAQEAARIDVEVLPVAGSSSTVTGVARGDLQLLLVNRREQRVGLGALRVEVEGLRVERVEPAFGKPLAAFEDRVFRIGYVVPDCDRLVLPGVVLVSLTFGGEVLERKRIPVREPGAAGQGFVLAACPASARGPDAGTARDVGVRPAGGTSRRLGDGAEGVARLEIRNGGEPVRLQSVTAEVPGVAFGTLRLDGGRSLDTDGLVIVRLPFRIPDCAALEYAGRLVLRLERFGAVQEVGLSVVAEPEARAGPQVTLPVVYGACRRGSR